MALWICIGKRFVYILGYPLALADADEHIVCIAPNHPLILKIFLVSRFPKIYSLEHGWATRYYWLSVLEEISVGMDFYHEIRNRRFTFCKYSGTTPAAIHGSTLAIDFFSETLASALKEPDGSLLESHEIQCDESLSFQERYLALQPSKSVPRIQNEDIFKEPDLHEYCAANETSIDCILDLNLFGTPFYADMSKWDSSPVFTVQGTRFFLIMETLAERLKKEKFKNLFLEERRFCE